MQRTAQSATCIDSLCWRAPCLSPRSARSRSRSISRCACFSGHYGLEGPGYGMSGVPACAWTSSSRPTYLACAGMTIFFNRATGTDRSGGGLRGLGPGGRIEGTNCSPSGPSRRQRGPGLHLARSLHHRACRRPLDRSSGTDSARQVATIASVVLRLTRIRFRQFLNVERNRCAAPRSSRFLFDDRRLHKGQEAVGKGGCPLAAYLRHRAVQTMRVERYRGPLE